MKQAVIKKAKLMYKPATASQCWKSASAFHIWRKIRTGHHLFVYYP